jgi:hypothetical protein
MKRATVKYICNGYSVELSNSVPEAPQPSQLVYATTVAECVYYLAQFFEGVPRGSPPVQFGTVPSNRAAEAVDPLMNQEAQIVPTDHPGYMVRQATSLYVPTRPPLDEFCATMDEVALVLDAVYSDGSIIPPVPAGDFDLQPSVDSGGQSGAITVGHGPAEKVEHYRMNLHSQNGQDIYDGSTTTDMTAAQVAALMAQRVNEDAAGHMNAVAASNRVTFTPRATDNRIVTITAGMVNGVQRRARAPLETELVG